MKIKKNELLALLLKQKFLSEADAKLITEQASEENIADYLLSEQFLTKDLLGQALSEFYHVKYFDLNSTQINPENLLRIPEDIALKFKVIFLSEVKQQVTLTTAHPDQLAELKEALLTVFPDKQLTINYSVEEDIASVLTNYRKPIGERLKKILESKERYTSELINEILKEAIAQRASDVHFEPLPDFILLRFRIDGVLHEILELEKDLYENILNRIKIMADIRIDQHFSPQDGAVRFLAGDQNVDLRVSITPTIEGEKIVLRLLSDYASKLSLEELGFSKELEELIVKATQKTTGMILTTGPTGSGKTTTLYSLIKRLQNPRVNITTIEDPVEYRMKGINQIQVDQFNNVTFARGLRSIVRQDPDIILVGEIRDQETAEISINAALTGHLLLSTFHANDAASAIPRLMDMGIEPFLLASTLNIIVAQRLVRKICEHCRTSKEYSAAALEKLFADSQAFFSGETVRLFEGKGCKFCNNTGFRGRIGIFEVILITEEIMDMIMANQDAKDIWKMAVSQGSKSFFEDGMEKVKAGNTTINELIRVAPISFANELKARSTPIKKKSLKHE
ncbi:MAG: GspE/PulE family protein [bacterium]